MPFFLMLVRIKLLSCVCAEKRNYYEYNVMYCTTIPAMIGCVLLDYLFAFTVLGLAGLFLPLFKNKLIGAAVGTAICGALRFLCSFLSGWLLWGSYAPEGWSVAYYSFIYNGSYMLPNIIIGVIVILIIGKTAPGFLFQKRENDR